MRGHVASLNAAVAGSILVFEAAARRSGPDGPSARPTAGSDSAVPPEASSSTAAAAPEDDDAPPSA